MKRTPVTLPTPDCLGWYTACVECDGEEGEAHCAVRDGCRALVRLMGGEKVRDAPTVVAVRKLWPPDRLVRYLGGAEQPKPQQAARAVKRETSYRPTGLPKYKGSLAVADAIVARLVREADRILVSENESPKHAGELYLRWHENHHALIRESRWRKADRTVAKLILRRAAPALTLKVFSGAYEEAYALEPPRGVPCRLWTDSTPRIALVGVTAETARDAGSWLARVLLADLIGRTL